MSERQLVRYYTTNHFANGSGPTPQSDGTTLIDHAAETPYKDASALWEKRNSQLRAFKDDYQVLVLPPYDEGITQKIANSKLAAISGRRPVTTIRREIFPEKEDRFYLEDHDPLASHVYLIASPTSKADLVDIQRAAWYVTNDTQAQSVTAIFPFLTGTRQDKNVGPQGQHMNTPINIAADLEAMHRVASYMSVENHSFGTQTAAATLRKPFLPTTPWKFLIDQAMAKPITVEDGTILHLNAENTVMVRPDAGRNIAAIRATDEYGLPSASFSKERLSPTETRLRMSEVDQETVGGKICLVYDDELGTAGTINNVANNLQGFGANGLVVVGVHAKFTGAWEHNIQTPFIKKVLISDSRPPVGNIQPYVESGKIEVVSLEPFIAGLIEADQAGVNFWDNKDYEHLVLQSHGAKECS